MKLSILVATLPLVLAAPGIAAPITEQALARHIDVLASDAFQGRKPGTPGETKAVAYIAGAFQAAGLSAGAANGGWYQPVGFVERTTAGASSRWTIAGKAVPPVTEMILIGREAAVRVANAPVVFVGYGISGNGRDDLNGVDLTGAVALMQSGAPKGMAKPPRSSERVAALLARGVASVITIASAERSWAAIQRGAGRSGTGLASAKRAPVQGVMSAAAFTKLVPDAAALLSAADGAGFRASVLGTANLDVRTAIRPFTSYNVVGKRPGIGGTGETVLFTGHWDHLGICRPEGAPDRICNGAVDNASGIASMIETARELGQGPKPVRDEVFVATTGEEMGLLGMEAWADAPTVPLDKVVAAINVDTVAIAPRGLPVAIVGRGLTKLDPVVDATARRLGREVDADLEANAFIDRQDGAVLVRRGVPAVMIGGSFSDLKLLEAFLSGPYHGPEDNPGAKVVLGGAAEDADLTVAVARTLADPKSFPAADAGKAAPSDL